MIFEQIEIENFFRVGDRQIIPLANQGLVLVTGENGHGKSTIYEAICWCYFGQTVRGYTADEVVNRSVGKNCHVVGYVSENNAHYRVARYRKHSQYKNRLELHLVDDIGTPLADLTKATTADTQAEIHKILGIDFETFIQGPMLPQGSFKRFSEMTDSEIKNVLERAVQVATIAKAHDNVKKRVAALTLELNGWLGVREALEQKIAWAEGEVSRYNQLHQQFDSAKQEEVRVLESKLQVLDQKLSQLKAAQRDVKQVEKDLVAACSKLEGMTDIYQKYTTTSQLELRKLSVYKNQAIIDRMAVIRELERLDKERLKALGRIGTCPTCGQEVTAESQASVIDALQAEADQTGMALPRLTEALREATELAEQGEKSREESLEDGRKLLEQAQEQKHQLESELAQAKSQQSVIDGYESDRHDLEQDIERVKAKTSGFLELIEEAEEQHHQAQAKLIPLVPKIRAVSLEKQYLEFWVSGFSNRGLKSFVLGNVVPYMNRKVAEYSEALTEGDLEIKFQTQTTLKSGETREQFNVSVQNKAGAENYAGNSGGERRRADLSINFTISDLVSARSRKSLPQRWFDEPFEGLDEPGVESVMQLLSSMVATSGSIFVITHEDHLKSFFNKTIQVVKENGQTKFIF